MDQNPRLWIVCPIFHDVAAFTVLRDRLLDVLRESDLVSGLCVQFVVVDDTGGRDADVATLEDLADVRVVTPPFNVGHQRAIVCGLRVILDDVHDSDLIVSMDADGEDRPEDLPRLLLPLLESPEDRGQLCVARRTKREESLRFRVLYFLFRIMFRILTGTTVRSGNYAAYRGWLARRMLIHPYFDLCYSSSLVSLDMDVTLIPCARGKRYAGKSRMNMLRLTTHGIRMLMPFIDRITIRALILFSATFALGVALSIAVLATKVFTSAAIPGWATQTLLGISLLSFLVLGNFVVLFVVFSHSRGISLSALEDGLDRSARGASASTD
jgi:polyisoprenyl-phosphate glycosyltransferase